MNIAAAINGSLVCQARTNIRSRGIFYGDNPFKFAIPVMLAQLSVSSILIGFLQCLLTPLGQTAFVAQMLGGMLMGPSFMGKSNSLKTVFPEKTFYVCETFGLFGCMIFLFLIGVKMDISMVKRSGKKALVIGFCTFFVPLILNTALALVLMQYITMDPILHKSLTSVAAFQSLNSFHVIACLLADLKLLNSELGRLAVSSSMISGICSWSWSAIIFSAKQSLAGNQDTMLWMTLCYGSMLILIIYILRPVMCWMVKQTAEGKAIKESYIFAIFIMVLGCAFFGEVVGQHFLFGPVILGMAVPDGPPLGSALVDKLDSFVSWVLLPLYYVFSGARINLSSIHLKNVGIVELLALFGFMGKLMSSMLPCLYCDTPVLEALSLGLIMSAQGVTDILVLRRAKQLRLVDEQSYSIMVISIVLLTGTISPIVKVLYKPYKRVRVTSYKRSTIQHARLDAELRMLACIYHQDSTPSIIDLLEVTNPTAKSPICFYLVHLIELSGRSTPLLVAHQRGKRNSSHTTHSDHIINAFRLYEQQNQGNVMVNPYTAISPYATMHDDICELAQDKRVSMVIIPFHKQWTTQGVEESKAIRVVNSNILKEAPCSVGILVDRGTLHGTNPMLARGILYSIGMIFLGGPDDREALAYAIRMAQHPNVGITVIRFRESSHKSKYMIDGELDVDMINEFRFAIKGNDRHVYQEEVVKDSVGMISVLQSMENSYDLFLVGRRHASESSLFVGLTEWNEFPELGFIGDMLASSDSNCDVSVLVVQQQAFVGEDMMDSPKYLVEDSCAVLDMPREYVKVWPSS